MAITNQFNVQTAVPGGKRNLRRNFGLTKDEIHRYIKRCLNRSCRIIQNRARKEHKYEDNPYRQERDGVDGLSRAIRWHFIDSGKRAEIYIDDTRAPAQQARTVTTYGTFQREGTKGATPKRGDRLRFFLDRHKVKYMGNHKKFDIFMGHEGLWLSPKKVKGIKKDDFIRNAYNANRARIKAICMEELRRSLSSGRP